MGDEDRTRQSTHGPAEEPEVFEMGDSSIIPQPSSQQLRPPASGGGGGLAWLLFTLTLCGAGAAAWFYVLPQKEALSQAETHAQDLDKQVKAAKDELKQLVDRTSTLEESVQKKDAALKELTATKDELESKLKTEISTGDVAIKQYKGELVVDLIDQVLFPSGEAELNDKGKAVLKKVGETLLKVPDKVLQIGGHTDNQPIAGKLKTTYVSNWELSTARALNVLHYLQDETKFPGERLMIAGFAEFRPLVKNTKDGRKKNRRIEVVLLQKK